MGVLGGQELMRQIRDNNLIENLGGRDLNNPEGCGIDLRLGSVHKMTSGGAFIEADGDAGLGLRKGVETEEVLSFRPEENQQDTLTVEPGGYYLVQTVESLNTPDGLMPTIYPRSSLFRAGLLLLATKTDPGYSGSLTFGLANLSQFEVKLQMGARICNIIFSELTGESDLYRGQHQGGRVSFGEEKQV